MRTEIAASELAKYNLYQIDKKCIQCRGWKT